MVIRSSRVRIPPSPLNRPSADTPGTSTRCGLRRRGRASESARRTAGIRDARGILRRGGGPPLSGAVRPLCQGREGVEACAAPAPHRPSTREGKQVVGYGSPGKGKYAPELLRDSHRSAGLHRDRTRIARGCFTPDTHITDPRARVDRGDAARLHRRAALEPRSTRSRPSSNTCREWGARSLIVPIPYATIL